MGTFSPISRRVLNISARYFKWSPKIGLSAVDFEGFLKIQKCFKISKIFKIQNLEDTKKLGPYRGLVSDRQGSRRRECLPDWKFQS